jgi:adenylosuccinate lyase
VGSSAMAYKRNPMLAERMCSIARFLSGLSGIAAQTASTQWLERTLDDSASRRLAIPQAFLAADSILRLAGNIAGGLVVNTAVIRRGVAEYLPYLVTEHVLMAGVQKGGDRQELHERIRQHSQAVTARLKAGGANDLIDRLRSDQGFKGVDFSEVLNPRLFVGRAPEQVVDFLTEEIEPALKRYAGAQKLSSDISF